MFGLLEKRGLGTVKKREWQGHPKIAAISGRNTQKVKARFNVFQITEPFGDVRKNVIRVNTRIPMEIQHTRKKRTWVWARMGLRNGGDGMEVYVPRYMAYKWRGDGKLKVKEAVATKVIARIPDDFFDAVRRAASRLRPDIPQNMFVITNARLQLRTAWDISKTDFERLRDRRELRAALGLNY